MKIVVIGTRGFPNIPGGVEKHCEELFSRIAMHNKVIAMCRLHYFKKKDTRPNSWKSIDLTYLWCPKKKSFEAIIHSFLAIIKAKYLKPDMLHIHAIGPAITIPFARLLGLKVVFTHHGPDYERQKWGKAAKVILKLGEQFGVKFANKTIVISKVIQDQIKQRYNVNTVLIPNGVSYPVLVSPNGVLRKYELKPKGYVFTACRFVPEKGLHDLVQAYGKIERKTFKLVIAGDADHESEYSRELKRQAVEKGIILTGYQTGKDLAELYSNAGLFILPSYYEGLPIALLEALSYSLPVIVSDIPQHKEIGLPHNRYFRTGDIEDLTSKITSLYESDYSFEEKNYIQSLVNEKYNWNSIAKATVEVYNNLLS